MLDLDYYKIKIIADGLGYLSGGLAGFLAMKYYFKKYFPKSPLRNFEEKLFYYLGVFGGAMFVAILISTFDNYVNNYGGDKIYLTKSIAGAICGGVIASELFKKIYNNYFNTGVLFIPSLVIGTIVGRIGAFLIGLRDNTHGLPTNSILGYDYGDGILRHPAQLYEITVLLIFGIIFVLGLKYNRDFWLKNGFFAFCLVYFTYRFLVGFIMPYSHFWLGLNTIQIISILMIIYSIFKLKKY